MVRCFSARKVVFPGEVSRMKLFLCLVAVLLSWTMASEDADQHLENANNGNEVESYWREPLGWALEQIGKWLQVVKDQI
uniref:Putative secreted protein n=2 Tax=Rhipicephalus microplus TaxID=6941 RepID=A0A6M2DB41_RHIMP